MRPRGIPRGKHVVSDRVALILYEASMRPRGIPRGKRATTCAGSPATRRFNEAAGNTPRKTLEESPMPRLRQAASMRPRGIPRGKRKGGRWKIAPNIRFNEAAGNTPRKTRPRLPTRSTPTRCFNEAAGNTPRKTSNNAWRSAVRLSASMRPRGIPRGKLQQRCRVVRSGRSCFNEAAGNTPRKTRDNDGNPGD